MILFKSAITVLTLSIFLLPITLTSYEREPKKLDVPFEPSHPKAIAAMLKLSGVNAGDNVYDLGCGDGRIVIMAAHKFGARGVGVDISKQRISEAREKAR